LVIVQQPMRPTSDAWVRRAARLVAQFLILLAATAAPGRFRGRHSMASAAARSYAEAELIISTGGTYLVEHYRVWHRLVELVTVSFGRAPVVLWTQSLGPFRKASSKCLVRLLLTRAALVMLRDERSRGHLLALDSRHADKLIVVPDAAFALAENPPPGRRERDIGAVISVREWDATLDGRTGIDVAPYQRAMRAAVERLVEDAAGARVLALSTCQGLPAYGIDDSAYAAELFGSIPGVDVDAAYHRPEDLVQVLRRTRVVVATRMHLAILALLSGCQIVAIAYEFKTIELFTACGLGRHVIALADCTPDAVAAMLDEIDADPHAAMLPFADVQRLAADAVPRRALLASIGVPAAAITP